MDKKKLLARALLVLGIAAVAVSASTPNPIVHQVCDAVIKLIAAMGISLPISLVGGGTAKADPNKTPVPALLPLLLLPALLASGCATAGGQALKSCEIGNLPAVEQVVVAEVAAVILNPSGVVSDLIDLAKRLGPEQVSCAVQAWDAWLSTHQAAPVAAKLAAGIAADQRTHALELTHAYLVSHPSACAARPTL